MRRSPFCFHYTGFFRFFNPFLDKQQKTCYDFRRYYQNSVQWDVYPL